MINFKDLYNCFASELSFAVDMTPILEVIGEVEPENLTTELLTDLFGYLYDEKKIVGSVYGKYRSAVNELLYLAFCGGYIKDVPQIGVRAYTAPNLYNKPDDESLNEWIAREGACPAVTAVVLAWECGLKRCEIASLTWSSVDIKARQIRLEDREIPLSDKAVQYLKNLHNEDLYKNMEYVLISATNTAPVSETNISVMIKRAFERSGVATVRLSDLRFDYIIKQLNCYDWEYVSYVTGVDFTSLQEHFLPYSEKETLGIKKKNMLTDAQREALTEMLKKEKESVTGLAIRFMWFAGIPMKVLTRTGFDGDLPPKFDH